MHQNHGFHGSSTNMKEDYSILKTVALNDSLKHGFLSQQKDPVLNNYLKFEKISSFIGVTLIISGLLIPFLY